MFIYLYYSSFCKPFLIKNCEILILFYYFVLFDKFSESGSLKKSSFKKKAISLS
ncbi:hypothetical protein SCRDD08_01820 [Streptococcus cristatus]|uniref:Uncharacterized protein n=1 Tax=Streptococcus cristatus TaxID=45634 RepID=A0A139MXV8_STRCR|nr:hypothetical protein SCRDD08_01820 [Streptococcus cristatus]